MSYSDGLDRITIGATIATNTSATWNDRTYVRNLSMKGSVACAPRTLTFQTVFWMNHSMLTSRVSRFMVFCDSLRQRMSIILNPTCWPMSASLHGEEGGKTPNEHVATHETTQILHHSNQPEICMGLEPPESHVLIQNCARDETRQELIT